MRYVLCAVTVLYGLLSTAAAIAQWKTVPRKDAPGIMLGGGLLLMIAAVLQLLLWPYDWIIAAVGGVCICIAAFLNGKRGKAFHLSHHVIRFLLTALLAAGFAVL